MIYRKSKIIFLQGS